MRFNKFGLELRKIGDTKNLYQDVDRVLDNFSITKTDVGDTVKYQSVAHSLHKMLKPNATFYITTVKDAANLCGICIPDERLSVYRSIHCMSWSEMTEAFSKMIIAMVLDDFREIFNIGIP